MRLRLIRKRKFGVFLGISGSRVSAEGSVKNHTVKALFHCHDFIEQSLRVAGDSYRGSSIGEVFFRFRHYFSISGILSAFVFFIIFLLTLSTNVD